MASFWPVDRVCEFPKRRESIKADTCKPNCSVDAAVCNG